MLHNRPHRTVQQQPRTPSAVIALWAIVVMEAIGIGATLWYAAGGIGSR